MATIKVLTGGAFSEREVTSTSVKPKEELRSELDIPTRSSISINAVTIENNDHPVTEGDLIAAVENDKGGGI